MALGTLSALAASWGLQLGRVEGAVRSSAVLKARSNAAAATLATDTARALILGDLIEEETGSSRPRGPTAVRRKRDRLALLMDL